MPDGQQLLIWQDPQGSPVDSAHGYAISMLNLDTGAVTPLTDGREVHTDAVISPDGSRIWYAANDCVNTPPMVRYCGKSRRPWASRLPMWSGLRMAQLLAMCLGQQALNPNIRNWCVDRQPSIDSQGTGTPNDV